MKRDIELITRQKIRQRPSPEIGRVQSLQEKTGATAEQIRRAIEAVGFDREKVEQYLLLMIKK